MFASLGEDLIIQVIYTYILNTGMLINILGYLSYLIKCGKMEFNKFIILLPIYFEFNNLLYVLLILIDFNTFEMMRKKSVSRTAWRVGYWGYPLMMFYPPFFNNIVRPALSPDTFVEISYHISRAAFNLAHFFVKFVCLFDK